MKRVGFIGLGRMGLPMARNIAKAGYPLTVFNRTPGKAEALKDLAVSVAQSSRQLFEASDVVITMLSDASAVREVLVGSGIFSSQNSTKTIIDMSTIAPKDSVELANKVAAVGIRMLDAPVIGSLKPAAEGSLTIMVGGPRDAFDETEPILMTMGKKIYHIGKNGMGSLVKIAHNLLIGIFLVGFSEALALSKKGGVDPKLFLEILLTGPLKCFLYEAKGPGMVNGMNQSPTFTIRLMAKDLALATQSAGSLDVAIPLTTVTEQLYMDAKNQGMGELDYSAIIKAVENLSKKI